MKQRKNNVGDTNLLLLITAGVLVLLALLLRPLVREVLSSPGYKKPLAHDMEGWGHDPNLP